MIKYMSIIFIKYYETFDYICLLIIAYIKNKKVHITKIIYILFIHTKKIFWLIKIKNKKITYFRKLFLFILLNI